MGKDSASASPVFMGGAWEGLWRGIGGAPAQSLPIPFTKAAQRVPY